MMVISSPKWKGRKEVSLVAMSPWGKRVAWLRIEMGMTYRSIAAEARVPFDRLYRMATQPKYEPKWEIGVRFNAFYERKAREAQQVGIVDMPSCDI